jgi:thiazole/oxazole-forming peptide maturase SagD family component
LQDAMHPNQYLGFSDAQFNKRDTNNRAAGLKHRVPPRFDPSVPIEWTAVWSIDGKRRIWIPSSLCYYGHPESDTPAYCRADSNGAASGNCIEEALLHALYEIIERDCAAQWWYNRIPRPGIELDALPGWDFVDLRTRYRNLGRDLEVVDITNDLGVPAVAATSADLVDKGPQSIVYGFGCHSDPGIAISRAISEVTQSLPAVMHRTPTGRTVYGVREDAAITWWEQATRRSEPYLNPRPGVAARFPASTLPSDLDVAIKAITERIGALGLDIYVLDQSRAEVDLSVVKVFIPGMCHFWNRFGQARLYSVPVKLGWLDAPTAECDLNPWHIYF